MTPLPRKVAGAQPLASPQPRRFDVAHSGTTLSSGMPEISMQRVCDVSVRDVCDGGYRHRRRPTGEMSQRGQGHSAAAGAEVAGDGPGRRDDTVASSFSMA